MTRFVRFLRSILCAMFFIAFGLGGLLFSLILLLPVSRRMARGTQRLFFRFFVWSAKVTGLFVVDVSQEDAEILRELRGSVVVANHVSLIDFVILVVLLGDSVCITKEAVGRNPFMRIIARRILVVNSGTEAVMRLAGKYLAEGVNLLVFPEGTRTSPSAPEHVFKRGAARIALDARAPVETISIACDPPVLGKGQPWWDVGAHAIRYSFRYKGRVAVNPPIQADDAQMRRLAREITQHMKERVFA